MLIKCKKYENINQYFSLFHSIFHISTRHCNQSPCSYHLEYPVRRLTRETPPKKKAKRNNIRWDAIYANKIIDKLLSTFPRFFE